MLAPAARRRILFYFRNANRISQRRACGLAQICHKALQHRSVRAHQDAPPLIKRLTKLGEQYPRSGYPLLHGLTKAEALVQTPKWTYRLYCELGT